MVEATGAGGVAGDEVVFAVMEDAVAGEVKEAGAFGVGDFFAKGIDGAGHGFLVWVGEDDDIAPAERADGGGHGGEVGIDEGEVAKSGVEAGLFVGLHADE